MRVRLLIAKATEVQLQLAVTLLRQAVANLSALRYGVEPGLEFSRKALGEAEKAYTCVENLIKHIPEHE